MPAEYEAHSMGFLAAKIRQPVCLQNLDQAPLCISLVCRRGAPLAGADCASCRIGMLDTLSNVDADLGMPGAACLLLWDCGRPVTGRLITLANFLGACCALGTGALFLSWILLACAILPLSKASSFSAVRETAFSSLPIDICMWRMGVH